VKQAQNTLQNAIAALKALAATTSGETFEALAWLHAAKESIAEAETLIDAERSPLRPPMMEQP
jgi:hypothetical protein